MQRPMFRLLGPLQVELAGRTLGPRDLGGRKPKQILEILLLADGQPVRKDRLAQLLWDHDRPRNVAATIDTYLSVLRRAIGRDRSRTLLITEPEAYRLARSEADTDLDRVTLLTDRARREADAPRRLSLLQDALSLVRGELLADEPDANWTQAARSHTARRILDTRVLAGHAALAVGDTTAALVHADTVLETDALDERGHRLTMAAHADAGATPSALRAYEHVRELLVEELGADPSAATQRLHLAILRGEETGASLEAPAPPAPSASRASARRGRALRVLLVEDSPADAQLIGDALATGSVPIRVDHVTDGAAALRHVRDEAARPDLVLLDVGLPGLGGIEVLAEIKGTPGLRRIPVVMLTSSVAIADVERSYDLHANGYVAKPMDADDFASVVHALEAFWPLTAAPPVTVQPQVTDPHRGG